MSLTDTGAALRTLNLSGDKTLSLAPNAATVLALTKIDASAATGAMTVKANTSLTGGAFTFTGGSGNDTITFIDDEFGTLIAGSQLDGGAGTGDKLGIFDTALTSVETAKINATKGFEVLGLNAAITLDASTLTSIKSFSVDTTALTQVISSMATGSLTTVTAAAPTSLTLGTAVGVTDTGIALGTSTSAAITVGTLVTTGITNVALSSNGTAAKTITTLTNSDNSSFTITGAADLTIANALKGTTTGSVVDASAFTGKLSVIGSAKNDIIKGGTGADTIQGATTNTANQADTLTGGAGADTFVFNGSSLANLMASSAGTTAITKITDFVAGTDKIKLVDGVGPFTSITLASAQTIASAADLTAVYAGITAIGASTQGGAANGVPVTVTAGAAAGTYLYINDATAGVSNSTDTLINMTGITGTLAATDFVAAGGGSSFTLTTGVDNFSGTSGNDTFVATYDAAVTDTFAATDILAGNEGTDTLTINHLIDVAITPPDTLWTGITGIEKIVINTTGNGAQTTTTGAAFQAAFAAAGVDLTTTTSGTGAITIDSSTFTGAATLTTTSGAGAQTITTGSGVTTVTATSAAGALTIAGANLATVTAITTGAGAQTITSTGAGAVTVIATSDAGATTITTGAGKDTITLLASAAAGANTITGGAGADTITLVTGGLAATDTIVQANGDSKASTADTTTTIAAGQTITFGTGLDIINGFAGATDVLNVGTAGAAVTGIGLADTAFTATKTIFLSGAYVAGTGVFTIAADGAGADTLLLDTTATADQTIATADTWILLVGTNSASLIASSFI